MSVRACRSTRCPWSSGMGSAHSSQTSPARGMSRGWLSRIRCSTASGSVTPPPPRPGTRRTPAWPPARRARSPAGSSAPRPRCGRSPGAASTMATSTAPCSVLAEEGQPSQLPRRRSLTAPQLVVDAEQLDVATVLGQERPDRDQRRLHPVVEGLGVQAVHQQEAGHQLVLGRRRSISAGRVLAGPALRRGRIRRRRAR